MSLEFIDGFDHYTNSVNGGRKWDTTSNPSGSQPGRFGGFACGVGSTGVNMGLTQGQLAAVATRTIGFALFTQNTTATILWKFMDSGTEQVSLRINSSGNLFISRNGTTLATSTQNLLLNTWYYIEIQTTIGTTTGAYTLRVTAGGAAPATWLTATGVNTQVTANPTANQVQIFQATFGLNFLIDDIYILNSLGTVNNTFLGECRIFTTTPNAEGTTLQLTPNAGTAHFSRVNEIPPDDDTTFNSSATPGLLDTYKFPAIAPTGAILGVQNVICARKDDVGTRTVVSEARSGGTNYDGAIQFSPTSSYLMFRQLYENDPATGIPWILSGVNAAEFGMKVIA